MNAPKDRDENDDDGHDDYPAFSLRVLCWVDSFSMSPFAIVWPLFWGQTVKWSLRATMLCDYIWGCCMDTYTYIFTKARRISRQGYVVHHENGYNSFYIRLYNFQRWHHFEDYNFNALIGFSLKCILL